MVAVQDQENDDEASTMTTEHTTYELLGVATFIPWLLFVVSLLVMTAYNGAKAYVNDAWFHNEIYGYQFEGEEIACISIFGSVAFGLLCAVWPLLWAFSISWGVLYCIRAFVRFQKTFKKHKHNEQGEVV